MHSRRLLASARKPFFRSYSTYFLSSRKMSAFALPESLMSNPLVQSWNTPFGVPPFQLIKSEHFEPALLHAMNCHIDEVKQIANNPAQPSFDNTIATFDRSGALLTRILNVFTNLCSSHGVAELQEVELKMASPLASHQNSVMTTPGLFERISSIHAERHSSGLTSEQIRLVERFHIDFVRSGAQFDSEMQKQYGQFVEELAVLSTKFTQNVMADESQVYLELASECDIAGLPEDLVRACEQAAADRQLPEGSRIVTLSRSLVEPFLTYSTNRSLREKAWKLWTRRGELNDERHNLPIATRMLTLREQQAHMHKYENFAAFSTADTMAGSPDRVMELLEKVWTRAKDSARQERVELETFLKNHQADQLVDGVQPWDWRYVAEKVRVQNYCVNNAEVKEYFPLNRMIDAIFYCAQKLFGLSFVLRTDIPTYHEDVQLYEVRDVENSVVALFLHDNYARPCKRSGAWMSEFRAQHRNHADGSTDRVVPIVINNNNFNKPARNEPCLLSFDDAVTLFHEFGHGLHGMLSDVHYQRLCGTSVLKDFVELPSQLFEHWLSQPQVLEQFACHFRTGEPIPAALLDKVMKARKFNQGFQTIEYTSSALVDMKLHSTANAANVDLVAFEQETLSSLGMPQGIVMRHRLPHFQHLFSNEFYASGYYVYLWAEVLDADGFEAFSETGDCFNAAIAKRVYDYIYSAGNSKDPAELYRLFRGRDPVIEPMLRKKGLL